VAASVTVMTTGLKTEPKLGTNAPRMGTPSSMDRIGTTLFGKTQRALLAMFFVRPEQLFYLRQIVRTAGIGQGTVQRELARWVAAGLLTRTRRGNQVCYQANTASPVYAELKALTVKTAGMGDVLREALTGLAERVTVAFVHGSVARGTEQAESDVDVVVVGDVSFGDVAAALQLTSHQKVIIQVQDALARIDNAKQAIDRKDSAAALKGEKDALKAITAIINQAGKTKESKDFVDRLRSASAKLTSEINSNPGPWKQ